MAIQNRRGVYDKFDPQKMVPGEWAVVISGDEHAVDGKAVYMCFAAGNVKRMATYEDMVDNIQESSGEAIAQQIAAACNTAIQACQTATNAANTAKSNADRATTNANNAASAANTSKTNADAATARAIAAAEACEGIADNTRITALETQMQQVISILNKAIIEV